MRAIAFILITSLLSACATDPYEPGAEQWYIKRMEEIESAKAAGKITEGEYLTLKGQADATRSLRINAERYNNSSGFWGTGYND